MESSTPKGDSTQDSVTDLLNKLPKRIRGKIKVSETYFYNGTPCWEWTESLTRKKNGYARTSVNGVMKNVNTIIYEFFIDLVPNGFELDHLCKITRCVLYLHMEPVTRDENRRRAVLDYRARENCGYGHKFTEESTYIDKNGTRICKICRDKNVKKSHYRAYIKIWEKKDPSIAKIYEDRVKALERRN
jgi:hypothetical protein